MKWYRFKIWRFPDCVRPMYVDGKFALSEDVALGFFLDRSDNLRGWHYAVERCVTVKEELNAHELQQKRTEELKLDDLTIDEFVEWMRQPATEAK